VTIGVCSFGALPIAKSASAEIVGKGGALILVAKKGVGLDLSSLACEVAEDNFLQPLWWSASQPVAVSLSSPCDAV
jgi:hypothetical protein